VAVDSEESIRRSKSKRSSVVSRYSKNRKQSDNAPYAHKSAIINGPLESMSCIDLAVLGIKLGLSFKFGKISKSKMIRIIRGVGYGE
jgi:hypothetical protein